MNEEEDIAVEANDEEGFSHEDGVQLHNAIIRLSPLHREVLVLRYMEGLSYEEIASVVGRSTGTVRSRIHYAKRALRNIMKEKGNV